MQTRSVTVRTKRGEQILVAPIDQTLLQVARQLYPGANWIAHPDGGVTVTKNHRAVAHLDLDVLHQTLF